MRSSKAVLRITTQQLAKNLLAFLKDSLLLLLLVSLLYKFDAKTGKFQTVHPRQQGQQPGHGARPVRRIPGTGGPQPFETTTRLLRDAAATRENAFFEVARAAVGHGLRNFGGAGGAAAFVVLLIQIPKKRDDPRAIAACSSIRSLCYFLWFILLVLLRSCGCVGHDADDHSSSGSSCRGGAGTRKDRASENDAACTCSTILL